MADWALQRSSVGVQAMWWAKKKPAVFLRPEMQCLT